MKKPIERRQPHNIGTREERITARKTLRDSRPVTYRKIKRGKYLPGVEDKKHAEAA